MSVQKIRWSRVYESSEEELIVLLKNRKINAERFAAHADSDQLQYTTDKETVIWCAEGSMSIRTPATSTSLQPGDAIRIDAQTTYDLHPGISGYVYYVSS